MDQSPVNRVELQQPRSAGVLHHLAIGILFGVGLFIVGGGIYGLSYDVLGSVWVLGLGLVVLFVAEALRRANRNRLRPGAIEVGEAKLSIDCPPLLRGPIELELGNVRAAATAAPDPDAEPSFPVYGNSEGPESDTVTDDLAGSPDWLPVPSLAPYDAAPNAIVLFDAPVEAPSVRRASPNGPRGAEALGGIAVSVADAGEARRAFDAFKLRSRIHEEDLERLARIAAGEIRAGRADETPG